MTTRTGLPSEQSLPRQATPQESGRAAHEALFGLFRGGCTFATGVPVAVAAGVARNTASGIAGLSAAGRQRVAAQVCSAVSAYFARLALDPDWAFFVADARLGSPHSGRPDLVFRTSDGSLVADELKFGQSNTSPNERDISQARRYARALSTEFRDQFRGVRLIHRCIPETSLFIHPSGDVAPLLPNVAQSTPRRASR